MDNIDKTIEKIKKVIKDKKSSISKLDEYKLKTKGHFIIDGKVYNLNVMNKIEMISFYGLFLDKTVTYNISQNTLITNDPNFNKFVWNSILEKDLFGFYLNDLKEDIQYKLKKIEVETQNQELKNLETKLTLLESEDYKRIKQLEQIEKDLLKM